MHEVLMVQKFMHEMLMVNRDKYVEPIQSDNVMHVFAS